MGAWASGGMVVDYGQGAWSGMWSVAVASMDVARRDMVCAGVVRVGVA